jgi:NTF2-related export protein 1/2
MIKAQRQTPSGIEARVKYEVEGWDVHILNPEFTLACPENLLTTDTDSKPDRRAKDNIKASLLLQVTGTVSFGVDKDAPRKMFNDVFVLVPNWDTHVKNPPRNARRWLIMSQNFRAL